MSPERAIQKECGKEIVIVGNRSVLACFNYLLSSRGVSLFQNRLPFWFFTSEPFHNTHQIHRLTVASLR
jgi:hypothetical protein